MQRGSAGEERKAIAAEATVSAAKASRDSAEFVYAFAKRADQFTSHYPKEMAGCAHYFEECFRGLLIGISRSALKDAYEIALRPTAISILNFLQIIPALAIWPTGLLEQERYITDVEMAIAALYYESVANDAVLSALGADEDEPDSHSTNYDETSEQSGVRQSAQGNFFLNALEDLGAPAMAGREKSVAPEIGGLSTRELASEMRRISESERPELRPIGSRRTQRLIQALRRRGEVAQIPVSKTEAKPHPRCQWSCTHMHYRKDVGFAMQSERKARYVRRAMGDMSKLPLMKLISTRKETC